MSVPARVLVVDDDPRVVRLVRTHLDANGYRVFTAADGEQGDRLRGFELGADDYVTKPFAPAELVARVGAVLRRSQQPSAQTEAVVRCGDLTVDLVRRRVAVRGEPVSLTRTEFELLRQLALQPGKPIGHAELLTAVWGPAYRDDRDYLWTYVRYLRRKLEPDSEHPQLIRSEPGYGYVLECPCQSDI